MADGAVAKIEPQDHLPVQTYDDLDLTFSQRLILDPSIDLDRVERVLDMEKEAEKERQRKAFTAAKIELQSEIPVVLRNQENNHTKSTYADLAAIDAVLTPLLKKHGFETEFTATKSDVPGHMDCTFKVSQDEGHQESFTLPWPIDDAGTNGTKNKTGVQGMKSTLTFARRTMKVMFFDISDSDNDGNQPAPKTLSGDCLTPEQITEIRSKLETLGRTEEAFLQFMSSKGIMVASDLESVPIESYRHMVPTLESLLQKQGGGNDQQ